MLHADLKCPVFKCLRFNRIRPGCVGVLMSGCVECFGQLQNHLQLPSMAAAFKMPFLRSGQRTRLFDIFRPTRIQALTSPFGGETCGPSMFWRLRIIYKGTCPCVTLVEGRGPGGDGTGPPIAKSAAASVQRSRMLITRLLPSTFAARAIVSKDTDKLRGSSKRSS